MGVSISKDLYHELLWQFDKNFVFAEGEMFVFGGDVMAARALRELHRESRDAIGIFDIRDVTGCRFGAETKRGTKCVSKTIALNTQFGWNGLRALAARDVFRCIQKEYCANNYFTSSREFFVVQELKPILEANPELVFNTKMMEILTQTIKDIYRIEREKVNIHFGLGRYPHALYECDFDGDIVHFGSTQRYTHWDWVHAPEFHHEVVLEAVKTIPCVNEFSTDYESLYPRTMMQIGLNQYHVLEKPGVLRVWGKPIQTSEPIVIQAPVEAPRPAPKKYHMTMIREKREFHQTRIYRALSKPSQHKQKHR